MMMVALKDNGVRNLFALIQGIREAVNAGEESAEDYHHDDGNFEDPKIPDDEGVADDSDDAYEEGEDDIQGEGEQEDVDDKKDPEPTPEPRSQRITKALRKHRRKSRSMSKPKKSKQKASLPEPPASMRCLESKDSLDEVRTPPPKLPRANTEESYAEVLSHDREQELASLMAQIAAVSDPAKHSESLACMLNRLHRTLRPLQVEVLCPFCYSAS